MKQKIDQKTIIIIFMLMVLVFIISRIFTGGLMNQAEGLLASKPFDKELETKHADPYYLLDRDIIKPIELSAPTDRDVFQEKVIEEAVPDLVLKSIKNKAVPIVFKGSIERGDGTMIAQLNRAKRTHFVKIGDNVSGWKILDITKTSLSLTDPSGKDFLLKINETSQSDNLIANILLTRNNTFYAVAAGESFAGYKVLDIKSDYVKISDQSSEITLNLAN